MRKQEITSEKYPGVSWIERDDGSRSYYIRYRDRDTKKQMHVNVGSTAEYMTEAKAYKLRTAMLSKDNEKGKKRKGAVTLESIWNAYITVAEISKRRCATERSCLNKHLLPRFCSIADVSTASVDLMKVELLRSGLAPGSVREVMALLRKLLNFAKSRGLIKDIGVTFNMPKFDNRVTEMFTPEQAQAYREALAADTDRLAVMYLTIMHMTGIRSGALIALQWDDINFENRTIRLRSETAKNGATSYVYMPAKVAELLSSAERTCAWVFPNKQNTGPRANFRYAANRIKKRAGLPEKYRCTYMLRHDFASQLASSGKVSMFELQRALTHKTPTMVMRYAHLSDEAARRTAAVADEILS